MSRLRAFHGNFTDVPPHLQTDGRSSEWPGFHAGTQQAARELLRMKIEMPGDSELEVPEKAYMHMYEINHPVSEDVLDDPTDWDPNSGRPGVDELNSPGRLGDNILQYTNSVEDKGRISYVIPKHLVDGERVKYLGSQFWGDRPSIRPPQNYKR